MAAKNNDKPYKVYRAGHTPRRRSRDADMAELRDVDQRPADGGRRDGPTRRGAGAKPGAAASPRRCRRFRWWFVPLALFLALIVGVAAVGYVAYPQYKVFDRAVTKANKRVDKRTFAALTPDKGSLLRTPTTILILGADTRPTDIGRADTIMLMRVDPRRRTITQLSIPRDMRVEIPGYGPGKINSSYSVRALTENRPSPDITIKTVEQFTGVPINHIMLVNFTGLFRMVNAVGGVDVRVPETVSYPVASGTPITF